MDKKNHETLWSFQFFVTSLLFQMLTKKSLFF